MATTERKEAFQIIQWLNSTKLIFLTEYSKMKKNVCTEHQNMRTIVSSPAVYHVGIMTRLMSILTRLQNQREYKTEKLHRSQQVDAHEK